MRLVSAFRSRRFALAFAPFVADGAGASRSCIVGCSKSCDRFIHKDMDRIQKHLLPKRRIAERLRRAAFMVRLMPATESYDLLVNERVRVALRVAFPRSCNHHVTIGDRHYTYRYRSWH